MVVINNTIKSVNLSDPVQSGWQRIDTADSKFNLIGFADLQFVTSFSGSLKYANSLQSLAQFQFSGTMLRIMGYPHQDRSNDIRIVIDGTEYSYSEQLPSGYGDVYFAQVFEVTELANGNHTVEIFLGSEGIFTLDAIELSENGQVFPFTFAAPLAAVASANSSRTLYAVSSGLLFNDEFNTLDSRWQMTNSTYFSLSDNKGKMTIKHHASRDMMLLTNRPEGKFALEVVADYTPEVESDSGGLVLWQDATEMVEFLESSQPDYDKSQSRWLAVVDDYDTRLYSDEGEGFTMNDTTQFSGMSKIGVTLKSSAEPGIKNMLVERIIATRGIQLAVQDLFVGEGVYLYDASGELITSTVLYEGSQAIIALPSLSVEGTLEIKSSDGVTLDSVSGVFHGGDVYATGAEIQVRMNGTEISRTDLTNLGTMSGGSTLVLLDVYNPLGAEVTGVSIAIQQYMDKFGWTWADIADGSTGSPGDFSDLLVIDAIPAMSGYPFYIRVMKSASDMYNPMEPLKLSIHLSY